MHSSIKSICLGVILSLICVGASNINAAETIRHHFPTLTSTGKIAFSSGNTVGTTELVTYTCTNAQFGLNSSSQVVLQMYNKNSEVVISPALSGLNEVTISFTATSFDATKIYLSEDGISWGSALESVNVTSSIARATIPAGNHFIKIATTKAMTLQISEIDFTFDDCTGCFTYDF